jgi:HAD superfamily hydrolase (TIGR01450 family)
MDGVLYRGGAAIPGAPEAVAALQAAGIKIVALTNNARASAQEYSAKLAGLGIALAAPNIITAGQAAAQYLAAQSGAPKVFIAGSEALRRELQLSGAVESEEPEYVVAGIDLEMRLSTLAEAVGHLHRGAKLIATNPDPVLPGGQGMEPEAGAVVAFLQAASGQTAYVVGKPNRDIFMLAVAQLGLRGEVVAVVGDTAETDIAGATVAGLRSIQLASGNRVKPDSPHRATANMADLAAVADRLLG